MKNIALFFSLLIFILPVTLLGQDQIGFNPKNAHYLWPTEASPYLSSTFAETRSAHFHAALDIKTWGQRGYKVYATRDGILYRIAIGPKGYGKVLYLKHSDGSFSVYAHLLSFNKELQQLADSIRFAEDYKFEINRYLSWKNIEIKQGEVIGYTGASGIGPPHLHFELRTPTQKPFNPLLTNLSVADNIPPQFSGISVEPLSPRSSVEQRNAIYTKRPRRSNNQYEFGTINISGPVGLGINVFDRSNQVTNAYAVYELSMSVNGREFFKARVDSFSYDETGQMFIDRVYPILQRSNKGFQRLYLADGNSLSFYDRRSPEGVLNLESGSHHVTIRATDYFGNTSIASLNLRVSDRRTEHPDLNKDQPKSTGKKLPSPHYWDWYHDWVTLPETNFQQLTIASGERSNFIKHRNGISIDLESNSDLFMNIPDTGPVTFRRMIPGTTRFLGAWDWQSFAIFPEQTFYDTVSLGMSVQKFSPDSIRVDIMPEAYPIRDAYHFYIPRDSALTDTSRISFYRLDRFDDYEWELIPTVFTDEHIIGEAESLGTFRLMKDTRAPELYNPRLTQRPDGQWLVMIDVTDNLSGIDYNRTNISVNGIRGIAEYEPEDDRFVYYHPDFSPSPSLKIDATAFDKMGNKQSAIFHLSSGDGTSK
jgi:hypothetical protein